jgi:hypothetical protein
MGKPQSNFQNRTIFGVPLIAGNVSVLYDVADFQHHSQYEEPQFELSKNV